MKALIFGDWSVGLDSTALATPALRAELDQLTSVAPAVAVYTLRVATGRAPALVIDTATTTAALTFPLNSVRRPLHVQLIAVLQTAARCLPLFAPPSCLLLHGSTAQFPHSHQAIAVLDGGLGQGKTSLALGLALTGYPLHVDEFTVGTLSTNIHLTPSPQLPWHVRSDMAPVLAPRYPDTRLLAPTQLTPAVTADTPSPLSVILIPDRSLPAGKLEHVTPTRARDLLMSAVTDHLSKLVNPKKDHVSLFTDPSQLRFASGQPLIASRDRLCRPSPDALDALATIPAFRVGIGGPADLATSVRAVRTALGDWL